MKPARANSYVPSGWHLSALLSWLLVLAVLSVLTAHFGVWIAWVACGIQSALIAAIFMRLSWDAPANWLLALVGGLMLTFRVALVLLDRAEYEPDIEHFETTPLDPNPAAHPPD